MKAKMLYQIRVYDTPTSYSRGLSCRLVDAKKAAKVVMFLRNRGHDAFVEPLRIKT